MPDRKLTDTDLSGKNRSDNVSRNANTASPGVKREEATPGPSEQNRPGQQRGQPDQRNNQPDNPDRQHRPENQKR